MSLGGRRRAAIARLDGLPTGGEYPCSELHGSENTWIEKNCYIDIWIEVLHSLGLNPLPMMPFTLGLDFQGDQWTFFKPPHPELFDLYGLDVQELNVWRPLVEHLLEHIGAGRLVSTEADAFWLPDTAGTDYRRQHTKTTIVVCAIDLDAGCASYFHNAGFFRVDGEDFVNLFRLNPDAPFALPLFAEVIRTERMVRRDPDELARLSLDLLSRHVSRRPKDNPIRRFAARWSMDAGTLHGQGLAHYHAWAFATLRQLGAAFELASRHLRWLMVARAAADRARNFADAADSFGQISSSSKALILKGARSVMTGKPPDMDTLEQMAKSWDRSMDALSSPRFP
jgi:hypothetical protein